MEIENAREKMMKFVTFAESDERLSKKKWSTEFFEETHTWGSWPTV